METTLLQRLQCLGGLAVLLGIAWALSAHRRRILPRIVVWGLVLQFVFAFVVLKTAPGQAVFEWLGETVQVVIGFADEGAKFIFGPLANMEQFATVSRSGATASGVTFGALPPGGGFVFFVRVSSIIIFFSSLMSVLYHLGIMQKIVAAMAKIMKWSMRVSGAESLAAAANVFVGMTEAPLVIRPYVPGMTLSEIMALMTSGFATIAGSVLMVYASFGIKAADLLAASVMSAPASLVMAKILLPETEEPRTLGEVEVQFERDTVNVIDAAAAGAGMGVKLAINVAAMVLAFVSLVAMLNYMLGMVQGWFVADVAAGQALSMQKILGWIFSPLAFCLGVEWKDCLSFGNLLGQKIVLNEFLAYLELKKIIAQQAMSPRSITMATYALCGFSNFGSIAITIGGIGTLAPTRRHDLAKLGLKAVAGGAMASMMTACVAGALL